LKRVIRNKTTGDFLGRGDTWFKDFSSAIHFPNIIGVIETQKRLGFQNLEVVLIIGDKPGPLDVSLPLQ